jgi:hypothetical protein
VFGDFKKMGKAKLAKKQVKVGLPNHLKKPKLVLDTTTTNSHKKHINTFLSLTKTKDAKKKRLAFSNSFFYRKQKNTTKLLNEIINGTDPKVLFSTVEDFDIHEFQELGAKKYSAKLTREISELNDAQKYIAEILKNM